ncbi:Hsp20/alpha crystallin family protein [Phytoactinopolyspora limicola]|uniref:Hsp20/alpha crystallin family protein n=1 Tax=Phytoactinopolyspora limicola TaxID=2715536 RepID=UPI001408231B|nr:Hsp20/alpha crystallin family protein [Phytoactinopolyspora limicola]
MTTRFDPFREIDRLADHVLGTARNAATMPLDLYRSGHHYVIHFDLPGVDPGSIDVSVENRTLTVRAQRTDRADEGTQWLARERPTGTYARQLTLGDGLSTEEIDATYADGVLTLTVPVAEQARPRRIDVVRADTAHAVGTTSSNERQEIQS